MIAVNLELLKALVAAIFFSQGAKMEQPQQPSGSNGRKGRKHKRGKGRKKKKFFRSVSTGKPRTARNTKVKDWIWLETEDTKTAYA
ncbi:MAG: hypothetical protein KME46_21785 [Brasilonema angustatum HA4187-MV1]|jgi:hypothetical protein|nr:hypothetical protein [Brasilonema angustatum HA4187-MV1]